jgi:hypothetical protein
MRLQSGASRILAACATLIWVCLPAMPAAAAEGSFQRTLKVDGPVNLEVTTGSGSIEVRPGTANQVQVTGHIRARGWFSDNPEAKVKRLEANPPILQSGNDIRIGHIDDPSLRRNVSISYEVLVPASTRLQAHSGSGNVQAQGVQGPAEISTGSGNIQVSDIGDTVRAETGSGGIGIDRVKGNVRAKTGSGSIHATGVAGGFEGSTGSGSVSLEQSAPGAVRVDTGSGSMELRGVRGSLEAKTGSGSIRVDGDPTGAWSVRSGSGGVRMRLPSDAAFDLNARTSSGTVSVNHPLTVQGSIGRKSIQGKVRGGGVPVQVETGSGDIDIQ